MTAWSIWPEKKTLKSKSVTTRYVLDCTDCSFQTTVVGTFAEVSNAIEAHRQEQCAGPAEHFVNVHRVSADE